MLNLVASMEQHCTASELIQNSPDPTLMNHHYFDNIVEYRLKVLIQIQGGVLSSVIFS